MGSPFMWRTLILLGCFALGAHTGREWRRGQSYWRSPDTIRWCYFIGINLLSSALKWAAEVGHG